MSTITFLYNFSRQEEMPHRKFSRRYSLSQLSRSDRMCEDDHDDEDSAFSSTNPRRSVSQHSLMRRTRQRQIDLRHNTTLPDNFRPTFTLPNDYVVVHAPRAAIDPGTMYEQVTPFHMAGHENHYQIAPNFTG